MRIVLSLAVFLAVGAYISEAKATKHKDKIAKRHKRGYVLDALDIAGDKCEDHPFCAKYIHPEYDCLQPFLKENCRKMCNKCGPKRLSLPAVLYYNKGKHAAKKRVARDAPKPQWQTLREICGNYGRFDFSFPSEYPYQAMPYDQAKKLCEEKVAKDKAEQTAEAKPTGARPAAAPAQTQADTYNPQSAPVSNGPSPTVGSYPAQMSSGNTLNVRLPENVLQQAKQGKDVYVAVLNDDKQKAADQTANQQTTADQTTTQQMTADQTVPQQMPADQTAFTQQTNDQPQGETKLNDKSECPYGECPKGWPKPPKVTYPFMVYCDDKFPNCGVLHSSCNDSWLQLYCQKKCNLCKPNDQQQAVQQQQAGAPQQDQLIDSAENRVFPSEVTELNDEQSIQSQLIAPEPGQTAQKAKYTLHVKPKMLDGKPQLQQIAIMPPFSKPGEKVSPLVILKQRVTKKMIENIEIDVPKKGTQYSAEPKVEVIEGNNKEILSVTKGQADLTNAEEELEAKEKQQKQAAAAQATQADTTQQTAQTQEAQAQATQTEQPAQQDQTQATQAQAASVQATATEQTQATQQSYQEAYQAQPAQQQADQTQATQQQSYQTQQTEQTQATQPQTNQAQATQQEADQTQATQQQSYQTQATQQTKQALATQQTEQALATQQSGQGHVTQQTEQGAQATQQTEQAQATQQTEQTQATQQTEQTQATQQTEQAQATQQQADQTQATQQQSYQTPETQQQADQTQAAQQQSYQTQQAEQTQATQQQADQPQATQQQDYQKQASQQPTEPPQAVQSAYTPTETSQQTANVCVDDTQCSSYPTGRCSEPWLQTNCKKRCNLPC